MNKIICPNCKTAFKIDEAGFADILKQVRDEEFNKDLKEREQIFTENKENAVKLAVSHPRGEIASHTLNNDSLVI